jgi:hypothetical protein
MTLLQSLALGVGACALIAIGTCFAGIVFRLDPHGTAGTVYAWSISMVAIAGLCAFIVAALS